MATLLFSGCIMQLRAWCTDGEQASVNTWYFQQVGSMTPGPTDQDFVNTMDTELASLFKGIMSPNSIYQGCQAYFANLRPLPSAVLSSLFPGPGTHGTIGLPRQTCGITEWGTGFAGGRGRGRTYWPFPGVSDDIGAGVPGAAYLVDIANLAAVLQVGISVTGGGGNVGLQLVLRSKALPATVYQPIITHREPAKWATQRRRGSFGRANVSPF